MWRRFIPAALVGAACAVGAADARAQTCSEENGCDSNVETNYSGVLGGQLCSITFDAALNDSDYSVIGGGYHNQLKPDSYYAAIAGGKEMILDDAAYAFIGGGSTNISAGIVDAPARYASTMGGQFNRANGAYSFIGGGQENYCDAAGYPGNSVHATILGGYNNMTYGDNATIGGGRDNSMWYGGYGGEAVILGGEVNTSSWFSSVVLGGDSNESGGLYSVTVGGSLNKATGSYSFAAGRWARANMNGCFVWSDSQADTTSCTLSPPSGTSFQAANAFVVRAGGGVEFVTNVNANGDPNAGVYMPNGGSTWYNVSDRNRKHGFQEIDPREVLARVVALPITTWKYNAEVSGARHMGPMAQDLYAAFGLGDDDKHVTSIDESGITLAAIQGLDAVCKDGEGALDGVRSRVSAAEAGEAALAKERAGTEQALSSAEARAAALEARLGIRE